MDITDPSTFVQSPAERYAAEHYSTPEKRAAHANGWRHDLTTGRPVPADGERCEWCGQEVDEPCADTCDCPSCETERALDESADMYADRS